jgi:hypothetical protein
MPGKATVVQEAMNAGSESTITMVLLHASEDGDVRE